jgi:glycosyltransferase involved in cell wall biosynthesis
MGTPVVASDIPAHREILGDAARLVPVGDADALATQLDRLLGEPASRAALRSAGLSRSRSYRWADAAERTVAIYRGLCP